MWRGKSGSPSTHDAEEDAFACATVAIAACDKLGAVSLYDLPDRHGLRIGRLFPGGHSPCGGPRLTRSTSRNAYKLRAADITPTVISTEGNHSISGKAFVFTGAMSSMVRRDAMQAVVDCGGICHDTLKADSNYLILGQEGFIGYQSGFKSSKIKKAELMKDKGKPIEILSEEVIIHKLAELNNEK